MEPLPRLLVRSTCRVDDERVTATNFSLRRGAVSLTVVGSELLAVFGICIAFATSVVFEERSSDTSFAARLKQKAHPVREVVAAGRLGRHIAIAWDDRCMIFDQETNRQRLAWMRTGNERLTAIAASRVDELLVLATSNNGLQLVSTNDGIESWQLPLDGLVPTAVAFSPDGQSIAVALDGGSVAIVDVEAGIERNRFRASESDLHILAFSADSRQVLAPNGGSGFRVWDAISGQQTYQAAIEGGAVTCLAASSDGRYVAVGTVHGTAMVWDCEQHLVVSQFKQSCLPVLAAVFLPDEETIAFSHAAGSITRVSLTDADSSTIVGRHQDAVRSMTYCGGLLISGGFDGLVRTWNLENGLEGTIPAL